MSAPRSLGGLAAKAARNGWRAFRWELERPWREGRPGTAAETGRWIGLGLAVGAVAAGLGAAVYVEWRRSR